MFQGFRASAAVILFIASSAASALNVLEPHVQCTVVKVHSVLDVFGIKNFPSLYQSLNNHPSEKTMHIANVSLNNIKPITTYKSETLELITIQNGSQKLELELHGKPISRQGVLKSNGVLLAELTCH